MLKLIAKIHALPAPLNWIILIGGAVLIVVVVIYLFGQIQSCNYDRSRKEYEAEKQLWTQERTKLLADAEAKEKRIAELEPKAIAFDAVAQQNKKIDAGLAQQIEEVSKNAAEEEARASEPTDCLTRIARVCERLRAAGIPHDCFAITKESCQ
jgi:uncharacterized protein HemX